jgi:large subunit ribosomal protein L7/L12
MAKKEEKEIKIPEKFKKLIDEIENMKVSDLAEFVKVLEEKFGVSAAPSVLAQPQAGAASAKEAAPSEEKTEFDVILKEVGEKKIEVIKAVRDILQIGLKEAKDFVDGAASEPKAVKEKAKKEEAEEIKKKLEEAGAKVELK